MVHADFKKYLEQEIQNLKNAGLFKEERIIVSPQSAEIELIDGKKVLNFCANNYLGLSSHPKLMEAAHQYLNSHGLGLSSVRFICGTQNIHKQLEQKIARFLGTEDAILFAAAFDANGGVFESLFSEKDIIISDELNHASIIDGIRLCKASKMRYKHNDMDDLEEKLKATQNYPNRLIVTDGVFSMDGTIAQLDKIVALAEKYQAMIMIDECHASGFMGKTGRGTHEYKNVVDKIDIITGTLGKALGGASGGFIASSSEIITLLRQRARPYLFSNTLAPAIVGASIAVLDLLSESTQLRDQLENNTLYFRKAIQEEGFDIKPGVHPIVPIMLYEAKVAQEFAAKLLEEGIYVIGFFYPVVPKGQARIRVQISAAHTRSQLKTAIQAFTKVGKKMKII